MSSFQLNLQLTLGEILTFIIIVISVVSILIALNKDRHLRRKEQADKVRHAAGVIIAKLERWCELGLRYFEDVQPIITEADIKLVKEQNLTDVRDFLWHELVNLRNKTFQRILDEQIETAYADLYGYDPRIQELFVEVVSRFKQLDQDIYMQVLMQTQENVFQLKETKKAFYSAQLGNKLRETSASLGKQYMMLTSWIVAPFRNEMIKLIKASDSEVVNRKVEISAPEKVIPARKSLQEKVQNLTEREK